MKQFEQPRAERVDITIVMDDGTQDTFTHYSDEEGVEMETEHGRRIAYIDNNVTVREETTTIRYTSRTHTKTTGLDIDEAFREGVPITWSRS